jgi:hypothetical protein
VEHCGQLLKAVFSTSMLGTKYLCTRQLRRIPSSSRVILYFKGPPKKFSIQHSVWLKLLLSLVPLALLAVLLLKNWRAHPLASGRRSSSLHAGLLSPYSPILYFLSLVLIFLILRQPILEAKDPRIRFVSVDLENESEQEIKKKLSDAGAGETTHLFFTAYIHSKSWDGVELCKVRTNEDEREEINLELIEQ